MALGRPIPPVVLTAQVREELEARSRSRSLPAVLVPRVRIILMAADGITHQAVAAEVGLSGRMVGMWRRRFLAQGFAGLYDEPRPGAGLSISDDEVARLIRKTLRSEE